MTPEETPKRKRGCLFYGCLGGIVMLLVMLLAAWLGIRYFKSVLNQYTDTSPTLLPSVQMPAAQSQALKKQFTEFWDAMKDQRAAPPLVLTSDDINVLIADPNEVPGAKGRIYVTIEGDQLKGQVSVPMENLGLPVFHGRYLNGAGDFTLFLRDGQLYFSALNLSVKGKQLPELYMRKVRSENLARNVNTDPKSKPTLDQLESIEVKDGKLIITPKKTK